MNDSLILHCPECGRKFTSLKNRRYCCYACSTLAKKRREKERRLNPAYTASYERYGQKHSPAPRKRRGDYSKRKHFEKVLSNIRMPNRAEGNVK